MKRAFTLFSLLLLLVSCGKDDVVNPEDTLFRRLSRGKGIWNIVSIRDYSIVQGERILTSETNPDGQYIFYLNSEFVFGVEISLNTVAVVVRESEDNVVVSKYQIQAEWERVTLYTDPLVADYIFTVIENERDHQVWTRYEVNYETQETTMREVTLEYCKDCEPYYPDYLETEI